MNNAAPTNNKERLCRRHRVLREEIRNTLLRADAERYAAIADRMSDVEDRALAAVLADVSHAEVARDRDEIRDIDDALRRIEAGTYGYCSVCGASIAQQRLDAHPAARRCLVCQQVHEKHRAESLP